MVPEVFQNISQLLAIARQSGYRARALDGHCRGRVSGERRAHHRNTAQTSQLPDIDMTLMVLLRQGPPSKCTTFRDKIWLL